MTIIQTFCVAFKWSSKKFLACGKNYNWGVRGGGGQMASLTHSLSLIISMLAIWKQLMKAEQLDEDWPLSVICFCKALGKQTGNVGKVGNVEKVGKVGKVRKVGKVGKLRKFGIVGKVGKVCRVGRVGKKEK